MSASKTTIVTATELKQNSGALIKQAAQEGTHFIIERNGYSVAVLIPFKDYEAWQTSNLLDNSNLSPR
jgi:prevent-host-death family protein